jgi:hypothetical protein
VTGPGPSGGPSVVYSAFSADAWAASKTGEEDEDFVFTNVGRIENHITYLLKLQEQAYEDGRRRGLWA